MDTTTQTTTIVISFSGAFSALCSGRISASDLEGALFYFGCTRVHAIDLRAAEDYVDRLDFDSTDVVERAYQTLIAAVLKAETAGKVAWREFNETPSWYQLDELLRRNGLPIINNRPIPEGELVGFSQRYGSHYSYPAVIAAVEERELPYRVIWNR